MGINNTLDISASGIAAERMHMELIASNLANINSTSAPGGGPYSRKVMTYAEKPLEFSEVLGRAQRKAMTKGGGVEYSVIEDNYAGMQKQYNPGHPDADADGYITLPNVTLASEMTDLVYASKLYEANVTVFNATKKMAQETLQIQ